MIETLAPVRAEPAALTLPEVFEVDVTDEDILLGVRGDSRQCPIARASKRWLALQGFASPSARIDDGRLFQGLIRIGQDEYGYSHDASDFIGTFDAGEQVEPRRVRFERCPW